MLEVVIIERSPIKWEWQVCDRHGATIIHGCEKNRRAAKYCGDRVLFLLLAAGKNDPSQAP
jgi:predicted lipid carrier protein YhbT